MTIRHRSAKVKIYGRTESFPYYRLGWRVGGKSYSSTFKTYPEAKAAAEDKAKSIAVDPAVARVTGKDAAMLSAIRAALDNHYAATGRRYGAVEAVTSFLAADKVLEGKCAVAEAARGYTTIVAKVKRKPLAEAVAEFNEIRMAKTAPVNGKRSQLNPVYVANTSRWLLEFSDKFPNISVCDIQREFIGLWLADKKDLSTKSRNDRRTILRTFLDWCAKRDYLTANHRLSDAEGMSMETVEGSEIEFYNANELRSMLEKADGPMRAMIAIQAFCGVRVEEACRLGWENLWRTHGHLEVTAAKSKGRARRLVEMPSALTAWLEPHRTQATGPVWSATSDLFQRQFAALLESLGIPRKRNGLRHAFATFHFALHANENLTSALCGNSPVMIHRHYRGLATRAEGEAWFAVAPAKADNVVTLAVKTA